MFLYYTVRKNRKSPAISVGKQLILAVLVSLLTMANAQAVRIKDLSSLRGMRNNQLIGFSLVVGLNGTGDTQDMLLSKKPLRNALERMGLSIKEQDIKGRSIAGVIITATLPPFAKQGQKIDVNVSTLGNATSLRGGTLIMTPLRAPNREVYAVAQGPVSDIPAGLEKPDDLKIMGMDKYDFDSRRSIVPTTGRVLGGGLVEKEITFDLNSRTRLYLNLNNPDFTTAYRISKEINRRLGEASSRAVDAGTVEISVPASYLGQVVELLAKVENMDITPDTMAKVVIDERTGTVIMGKNVKIMPIAISYGNLNLKIGQTNLLNNTTDQQPPANNPGIANANQQAEEKKPTSNNVILFKGGVDIKEVVDGLNKIGTSNADLVEVLKNIRASGALQAELIVR